MRIDAILKFLSVKVDRIRYSVKYLLPDEDECSAWEDIYYKQVKDKNAPDGFIMHEVNGDNYGLEHGIYLKYMHMQYHKDIYYSCSGR